MRCVTSAISRVLPRLDMSEPDVCWPWPGALFSNGYGHVAGGPGERGNMLVHVVMFQEFVGAVPRGMDVDHDCHAAPCPGGPSCPHRRCCNWRHLVARTRSANLRRGVNVGGDRRAIIRQPEGRPQR